MVVAHAIGNFGAGIAELMDGVSQIQSVASAREKSVFEILFSELLRILIFGLPLLIGYLMLAYNSGKDAKNWESAEVSKEESMKVGL